MGAFIWRYCCELILYNNPIAKLIRLDQAAGGPPLIFDHQMAMDSAAQVLYVSGGRVYDGSSSAVKYSGLYSYEVSSDRWTLLQQVYFVALNSCYSD
jgi:hypothetical protein